MKNMISTVATDYLTPVLKSHGFKKRGNQWNRVRGYFVDVVTLQEANFSRENETVFTLNIGVSVTEFVEAVWPNSITGFLTEAECAVRVRLGDLLQGKIYGDSTDQWWSISSQDSVESVGSEVAAAVDDYAIPFLEVFNDYDSIADHLRKSSGWTANSPFHLICGALAEAKCNRRAEALARLALIKGKAWKDKIPMLQQLISRHAIQGSNSLG